MNIVGLNGFWIFLAIFHFLIGVFGIYRMRIRETLENPDYSLLQCLSQLLHWEWN